MTGVSEKDKWKVIEYVPEKRNDEDMPVVFNDTISEDNVDAFIMSAIINIIKQYVSGRRKMDSNFIVLCDRLKEIVGSEKGSKVAIGDVLASADKMFGGIVK